MRTYAWRRVLVLLTFGACLSLRPAPLGGQARPGPAAATANKRILLIADKPSHGPLQHEHNAGVWLLQKWLNTLPGVTAIPNYDGWPEDLSVVDRADAVFMFCSGAEGHPVFKDDRRVAALRKAAARGAGIMFYHWCTEPPAEQGHDEMLSWIGGYFALNYSVNPVWDADFTRLPSHPITRGVKPFKMHDEWYYNMRFVDGMRGVTPILSAVPPPETVGRDGLRSGNADVRARIGQPATVMWAFERADGGRGVGYSGGHYHVNLGNDDVRKLVLNALLWIAHVEVPAGGVEVTVTPDELKERLDKKGTGVFSTQR
jgi:hypothetical protein